MRVLVTGVTGFIGSWVARELLQRNHDVIGTARSGRDPARDLSVHARFQFLPADLDDPPSVQTLVNQAAAERAVLMAWYADPATYLRSPRNMDSLAMTCRLAKALYEQGCEKIVGAGSCAEYGPKNALQVETDTPAPRTVYGACKVAAFTAIAALSAQEQRAFAWARIFHIHGPGDAKERLIPSVVAQLRRGVPIDLTVGAQMRDHLHVADVGTAIASILSSDASGAINVCSGRPVSLRAVVEIVGTIIGRGDLLRFGARPYSAGEAMYLAGSAERLQGLGWIPRFGLEDGLRDAINST